MNGKEVIKMDMEKSKKMEDGLSKPSSSKQFKTCQLVKWNVGCYFCDNVM